MPFTTVSIPQPLINAWASATPSASLMLPPKNQFIAAGFAMLEGLSAVVTEGGQSGEAAAASAFPSCSDDIAVLTCLMWRRAAQCRCDTASPASDMLHGFLGC